jgi:hypothetical protein
MKTRNLIILLCIINLTAKAQVHVGVNAGANMGNIVTKNNGTKDAAIKAAIGYIVSGDVNIPINENLLFQTGLQYESIHNKVNTESTSSGGGFSVKETFTGKSHLDLINIPAKLFYKMPAGNGSFRFGAGPYLGIGINGRSKSTDITETTVGATTTKHVFDYNAKTTFGSADTSYKRINFGAGVELSYVLSNNISFSVYSNFGLANINNQDKRNSKTYAYGITIGYIFANKD